jgi:DNA-binding transcriptional MocR family regulator
MNEQQAEEFRYESVVRFIDELIDSGALCPGEKVPSLRKISKARGVSVSTALHAYRMLESQGVLEALPQSGFYVSNKTAVQPGKPSALSKSTRVRKVSAGARVSNMFELAADTTLAPLGCAIPSPELLAPSQLDKFLVRMARTRGKYANTYAPPRGEDTLRAAIARRSINWGHAVSAEDILITCGCTEALHLALKSITSPGDTIAVESPTYFGFLPVLQALHLNVTEIPTDAVEGVSLAALETAISSNSIKACLFSSAFNNPLGCLTSEEKKIEVLALLNKHRIPLVEDDVYGDIYFGAERPRPYSAMVNAKNVIYCSSFSKTVAPGYRIGWVASTSHIDKLATEKYATTLCGPTLSQVALGEYLNAGAYDNHLRGLRKAFAANISTMSNTIAETFPAGTRISRPEGGFVLWVELPKHIDARELFNKALKEDICFAPGDLFTTSNSYRSCLRISCGYPWSKSIERAVWKLSELAATV